MTRNEIFRDIERERRRQQTKWGKPHAWGVGDCSSLGVMPSTKSMVLSEECGEVSRAVLDGDDDNLKTELIQVAAVAVAWLESMN